MNIVKAGAYSAVATGARLLSGLVVIKLVAWFAGPAGVGKLGQFLSLMSLLGVLAGGGISSALVKYVAEYRNDPAKLRRLLGAGLWYSLAASVIVGCAALCFSRPLALWLFGEAHYRSLIWVLAVAQVAIACSNYAVAVINGFMDMRRVATIYVAGSALGAVITALLAYFFGLYGALLALVLAQAGALGVSLPLLRRSTHFVRGLFRPRQDREMTVRLARFSTMTLTSTLLFPLVSIVVRNHLAARYSWQAVGYWQAVSKVSEAYLLFVTMAINMYYLPRLSALTERRAFQAELRAAYRHVLPVVAALALGIYTLRAWITRILFSSHFLAALPLYGPQLVGDVLKIASFILSYIMLAKAMTAVFIVSEFVFSATYLGLVYAFTARFGLIGAMYAFAVNYALYLAFTGVVARRYVRGMGAGEVGAAGKSQAPIVAGAKSPLVSILIPAYNHERFVERCLDSALEDPYPRKELIVIDDGSDDGTASRIAAWAAKHGGSLKIDYAQRANRGLTATLNELARKAQGEFLRLGSSDDYFLPGGMQAQVGYLLSHPGKLAVIGDYLVVDGDDRILHQSGLEGLHGADKGNYLSDRGIRREIISRWAVGGPVAMVRRQAVSSLGYWSEDLRIDDWDFFLRLAARDGVGFVDVKVGAYRIHGGSTCRTPDVAARIVHLGDARRAVRRHLDLFGGADRALLQAEGRLLDAKIAFLQRRFGAVTAHLLGFASSRIAAELQPAEPAEGITT